jgi:class 3 adenylate cyclase/pimeloyl-ACP methyl ester carboxylesterase
MAEGTRRLVAIMFTDIVGYTALMGQDEQRTIELVNRARELLHGQLEKHGGRLLDEIGDGSLSSFDSAVSAVSCAREIQESVAGDPELNFRIGIHIGDVVFSDDRAYGDGVNVASRIHGLVDSGGICISDRVYDDIRNHPQLSAQSLGSRQLKNVNRPINVYVLTGEGAPQRRSRQGGVRRWAAIAAGVLVLAGAGIWAGGGWEAIFVKTLMTVPKVLPQPEQTVGFATTEDGVRIAYATNGEGPPILFVLGWITHLEKGFSSPIYNAGWMKDFGGDHLYVRYDGRGTGVSQRDIQDFSLGARVRDIEAVVGSLGMERFGMYAASAGGPAAIAYTVKHPERVTRLMMWGSFADLSPTPRDEKSCAAMVELIVTGWDDATPRFRNMFASMFIPDGNPTRWRFFTEVLRVGMTGDDAARFLAQSCALDVTPLLPEISAPTLIVHAEGDQAVPYERGRTLAAGIPGAKMVTLKTNNHAISPDEPAAADLQQLAIGWFAQDLPSD